MDTDFRGKLLAYLELARPRQWYKNLLLFVAVAFSKNLSDTELMLYAIFGFLSFCALSAAVYALNDIVDREKDRGHPKKSLRPIPSGRISVGAAMAFGLSLGSIGLVAALLINWPFFLTALMYLAVATSYSFYFKDIVILDAIIVAIGFVIRALAGAVAVAVPVSPWLVICVFLLAVFLAFGKRRHELALLGPEAENHRGILKHYTLHMVEDMMAVSTSTLIMAYSMYTFLATNQYMMLTIPFAIYGLLRYMFLVHIASEGGEPEMIFRDVPTLINVVCWTSVAVAVLYLAPEPGPIFGG
ncbi:MAG: decaprenyl-phosphate phosphoribosyltransferase [Thermoplasmata archaeon]|nr:decaprenyl-phosphate phosphoribosyltransferase [Thermoplasmata archaeon]